MILLDIFLLQERLKIFKDLFMLLHAEVLSALPKLLPYLIFCHVLKQNR
jgi:hypothetical protein